MLRFNITFPFLFYYYYIYYQQHVGLCGLFSRVFCLIPLTPAPFISRLLPQPIHEVGATYKQPVIGQLSSHSWSRSNSDQETRELVFSLVWTRFCGHTACATGSYRDWITRNCMVSNLWSLGRFCGVVSMKTVVSVFWVYLMSWCSDAEAVRLTELCLYTNSNASLQEDTFKPNLLI